MDQNDIGITFGYFYGDEVHKYHFYTIPKLMFTNSYFKKISIDAKVLYGMMMDRTRLSRKNNWFDKEGRVYIFYPVKAIMEDIGVCNTTVTKMLKELEGIGLIERKKQGLNRADIIFVKNFADIEKINPRELTISISGSGDIQSLDTSIIQSQVVEKVNTNNNYINNTELNNNKSIRSKGRGGFFSFSEREYSPEFYNRLEALCC